MAQRKFLTARWRNLILANYILPEELLRPFVPPGCVLDRYQGECWGSLVGFQFFDTRVLGIGWPGFRNFPEWNLRFYVSHEGRRGVCFVREFVPQRTVATMARVIYNEPYRSARMTMEVQDDPESISARYTVEWKGKIHSMKAFGAKPSILPPTGSTEHWFKEHSWGFGTSRRGNLIRYEVNHPEWAVYPVRGVETDIDWALLYGSEWSKMNGAKPASAVFAVGSEVAVFPKG